MERHGQGAVGSGWRSFDYQGVHFVGLNNVMNIQEGSLGRLGQEQLDWLRRDLAGKGDSTPIVLFAHIPLGSADPQWAWGTEDSAPGLETAARVGSAGG